MKKISEQKEDQREGIISDTESVRLEKTLEEQNNG